MADRPLRSLRRRVATWFAAFVVAATPLGAGVLGLPTGTDSVDRADGIVLIRLPSYRAPIAALGPRISNKLAVDRGGIGLILGDQERIEPSLLQASKRRLRDLSENQITLPDDAATALTWRETEYAVGQQVFRGFRGAVVATANPDKVLANTRLALVAESIGGSGPNFARLPSYVTNYLDPSFVARLERAESAGAGADTYLPTLVGDPG